MRICTVESTSREQTMHLVECMASHGQEMYMAEKKVLHTKDMQTASALLVRPTKPPMLQKT